MKDQLDMIDSILPDVVADHIAAGDRDVFLEALGADGLEDHWESQRLVGALRDAIACKQASHVGEMVIEYVTTYYTKQCYADIAADLETYTARYVGGD